MEWLSAPQSPSDSLEKQKNLLAPARSWILDDQFRSIATAITELAPLAREKSVSKRTWMLRTPRQPKIS